MNKEIKYYVCCFEIPKVFYDSYRVPKIKVCVDYTEDSGEPTDEQ